MTKKVNEIKPNVNNDHPDEPYMGVQVGWSRNGSPNSKKISAATDTEAQSLSGLLNILPSVVVAYLS